MTGDFPIILRRRLDLLLLTLLAFLILPREFELEFGTWLGDLARTSDPWSSFFENSLVKNPLASLFTAITSALLLLYGFVSFGVAGGGPRSSLFLRRGIVGALVLIWVVLPLHWEVQMRFTLGPKGHAHDGGVIQTEEAARFFLRGENPYEADYRSTPMAALEWGPKNPAVLHLPYLPFSFLAHAPFVMATGREDGFRYDARYLYLAFFLIGGLFVTRFAEDAERKHLLAMLWYLNPFLVPHLVQGRNDVMVLALLVAALALLRGGSGAGALSGAVPGAGAGPRRFAGAVLLGLACATKQFAILLLPFVLVYCVRRGTPPRALLPAVVVVLLAVLPFFLWSPGAFWDDTVAFNTGRAEISYPIGGTPGYGFANLVNVFGWVENRYDYFPFWLIQAPAILIAFALLVRRLWLEPGTRNLFATGALFLLAFLFFSRIFHVNYWGMIFVFFALAVFAQEEPGTPVRADELEIAGVMRARGAGDDAAAGSDGGHGPGGGELT